MNKKLSMSSPIYEIFEIHDPLASLSKRLKELVKYGRTWDELSDKEKLGVKEDEFKQAMAVRDREIEELYQKREMDANNNKILRAMVDEKRAKSGLKKGEISFNKENGDFFYGKDRIASLDVTSRDFYFIEILVQHIGYVVDYVQLQKLILDKLGKKRTEKSSQDYCHNIKSDIKSDYPELAVMIRSGHDKDGKRGYKLES